MAVFGVWKNGYIGVNAVDLSDHAREISLETSVAELPDNVHGDNVSKVRSGLENWSVNATFLQDFAAGEVDATFAAIGGVGHSSFQLEVGPSADAASATNPRYSGMAILASYKPFGGQHGVNMEAQASFRPASQLTRRVA